MTQHCGGLAGRCFNEWCCSCLLEKLRNSLSQQYTELCATREQFNLKSTLWAQTGKFNATNKNVLGFILEKCKNGLWVTRETIQLGIGNHYMIEDSTARFKSQKCLVVLYMDHKGLALC
jgi:hypothetical protein